jgi:hypothetical protein
MHDLVSGSTYAVSFDDGDTSTLFTARKTVTAVGAITPAGATEAVTTDTIPSATITIGKNAGGTVTFSTTDAGDTIQSTLAASLGSGVYVTKGGGTIAINGSALSAAVKYVISSVNAGINITASGLSSADPTITISSSDGTTDINPDAPTNVRTLTSAGHGGTAGELLAVWNGAKLIGTTKVLAVTTDTVTIGADVSPWAIGSLAVTNMQFADTSSTRYVNGPISVTTKIEEAFYLPTVTPTITTPADIPLVSPAIDPISWLAAIVAGTAFVPIQGSDLRVWDGPIYKQTTVSAQMSDALDTVSVSA